MWWQDVAQSSAQMGLLVVTDSTQIVSRNDRLPYRFTGKGPNGRYLCRWCGDEVQPPRRTWCSGHCVTQWRLAGGDFQFQSSWVRYHQPRCEGCGRDMDAELEWQRQWAYAFQCASNPTRDYTAPYPAWLRRVIPRGYEQEYQSACRRLGFNENQRLWQIDHRVPLADGGSCHIYNLRLLCVPCHKGETAKLARRLGLKRRRQPLLLGLDA